MSVGRLKAMAGPLQTLTSGLKLGARSFLPGRPELRRIARRKLVLKAQALFRDELTFRRNGFLWTGAAASSITEAIYTSDHYQDAHLTELTDWLKAHTPFQRPVVVNVGANIGDVALPLTRFGKRVIAIEPNPETFVRLQRNVRQNGLESQVTCCAVAIAERVGVAELVTATDPGNSEIRESNGRLGFEGVDQLVSVVSVRTVRMDDLLSELHIPPDDVALVWSDTQGFESQVIASGAGLWQRGTPFWVELWPKGLACHGGVEQFIGLAERHFTRIIPATRLGSAPEPISQLRPLLAGLQNAEFTDALLLP